MAHNENVLRPNESLSSGQWLRSKNGLFQAVMQEDGNFCIYRGDSYEGVKSVLWSTKGSDGRGYPTENGFHNINMQPDGNLVIRSLGGAPVWASDTGGKGRGSLAIIYDDGNFAVAPNGDWHQYVFQSGATDEIEEYLDYTDTIYDFKNATQKIGEAKGAIGEDVVNDTDERQYPGPTVSLSYAKTTSSTWKETTALTAGYKISSTVGVPNVASGTAEFNISLTQSFEFGKTTTDTEMVTVSVPVTVPPRSHFKVRGVYSENKVHVPFRMVSKAKFSGYKDMIPVHLEGVYEGIESSKLRVEYTDVTTPALEAAAALGHKELEWHLLPA